MLDEAKIDCENFTDEAGKPAGGVAYIELPGDREVVYVKFQNGPILESGGRNGAFVEDLLFIAKQRIEWYNAVGFSCPENLKALQGIQEALGALEARTQRRIAQGVEGTHKGN